MLIASNFPPGPAEWDQTFDLLLVDPEEVSVDSVVKFLWFEALSFSMSAILPNLVSPLDLLRMYSVSSSSLSVTIDHLCALLVTSHQLDGKH